MNSEQEQAYERMVRAIGSLPKNRSHCDEPISRPRKSTSEGERQRQRVNEWVHHGQSWISVRARIHTHPNPIIIYAKTRQPPSKAYFVNFNFRWPSKVLSVRVDCRYAKHHSQSQSKSNTRHKHTQNTQKFNKKKIREGNRHSSFNRNWTFENEKNRRFSVQKQITKVLMWSFTVLHTIFTGRKFSIVKIKLNWN